MSKIIVANWKNHPENLEEARKLFDFSVTEAAKYPNLKTVICPPEQFLSGLPLKTINYKLKTIFVGAQDVFWESGAENYRVKYSLVGHSDRRYPPVGGGDTDEIVNQKLKIALESEVTPILLVGEKEKDENRETVLRKQLSSDLHNFLTSDVRKVIIAYEPVWAISTNLNGHADTPENALQAAGFINDFLTANYGVRPKPLAKEDKLQTANFLYGGSVDQDNVADFLKYPEISGAVIGGASLRKEEFATILKIASEL